MTCIMSKKYIIKPPRVHPCDCTTLRTYIRVSFKRFSSCDTLGTGDQPHQDTVGDVLVRRTQDCCVGFTLEDALLDTRDECSNTKIAPPPSWSKFEMRVGAQVANQSEISISGAWQATKRRQGSER